MLLRIIPLVLFAALSAASHAAQPGDPGTTTVIINGKPHVYESTVSGIGADTAMLNKMKSLDKTAPQTDAALANKYKINASSSAAAAAKGNIIGSSGQQGKLPSQGSSTEERDLIDRYINTDDKTKLQGTAVKPGAGAVSAYTMDMLGISGVTATPKGITKSGSGSASFQTAQELEFVCPDTKEKPFTVGGWNGYFACEGRTVFVRVCPYAPGTRYCETDDELKAYTLADGSALQDSSIGLTLTATFSTDKNFKLRLAQKSTVAGVSAFASASAANAAASGGGAGGSGTNTTAGMLSSVSKSTNFKKALEGPGASIASCQEKAQNGETCDGTIVDTGWVNTGTATADCDTTVCLKENTTKLDWTERCTRSFTRTNYACSYVRSPIACVTSTKTMEFIFQCEGSECAAVKAQDVQDRYGNTSNCVHIEDSCRTVAGTKRCDQTWRCSVGSTTGTRKCDGGITPSTTDGYILTGTFTRDVSGEGGSKTEYVESWLGPDTATGSCASAPYPLYGSVTSSCENQGVGKARGACEAWYGRTMTESACKATSDSGLPYDLDESRKAGCGYCMRYSMLDSCLALMPTTDTDCPAARKSECTLGNTRCSSASPAGTVGICYAQEETYNCGKSNSTCETWGPPASCTRTPGIAAGVDTGTKKTTAGSGFSQAIIGLALLDASAKSINNCVGGTTGCVDSVSDASKGVTATDKRDELSAYVTKDDETWYKAHGGLPSIFNGQASECLRTNNGTASVNCCDIALDRSTTQCFAGEVQLALARRNKFTHYVGEYCKQSAGGSCMSVAELYCSFEGLLPRVVQEQGRKQIEVAQAGFTGADTTVKISNQPYYGTGETGSWAWHESVSGLHVYQWAWPSWCNDPTAVTSRASTSTTATPCPAVPEVWFATCIEPTDPNAASRCGTPPVNPFEMKAGFSMSRADPLMDGITAIHRQALVSGACDTATSTCQYKVQMTTAGNRVVLSRDTTFNSTTGTDGAGAEAGPLSLVGKTIVRPVIPQKAGPGPDAVTIQYSLNDGSSWSAVSIPVTGGSANLGGDEQVKLTLACAGAGASSTPLPCTLSASGTVVMANKPWVKDAAAVGPAKLDCSGFTSNQFSMLDLDRMDLAEWSNATSVSLNVNSANLSSVLTAQVKQMTDAYYAGSTDQVTIGAATSSSPEKASTLAINPDRGFGPFDVVLMVSGNYPEFYDDPAKNTNPVSAVSIDWGDGSTGSGTAQVSNGVVTRFTATHRYAAPTANTTHAVKVQVVTRGGTYALTKSVINSFNIADNTLRNTGTTTGSGQVLNNTGNQITTEVPGASVLKGLSK